MTKIVLTQLANLQNENTAVSEVNANSDTIVSSFDNTLSRDGTTPNQMMNNLDMNSNQIYNLPSPGSATSPARLQDVTTSTIISSVPPTGTSGAVVGFLNGNNTYSGNEIFSGNNTFSGTNTFTNAAPITVGANAGNNGLINFKGSTSGTTTVQATVVASGSLTLPAATDTLVGKATTDTLTNKTLDTAGTGNVIKFGGVTSSTVTGTGAVVLATSPTLITATLTTPTLTGVTNGSNAAAGNVQEYQESVIALGSATSLTSGATLNSNAKNLTSLTLGAGDWEVAGNVTFVGTSSTALSCTITGLSTTSVTFDQTNGRTNIVIQSTLNNTNTATTANVNQLIGPLRFSSSGSQTINLVVQGTFSASTLSAYGILRARRVR
ncbi:MAG TPA: hypothetical protein VGJ00_04025 [Rhabdochlamydiaceae bacterium]|jgi:hypothetical protein